jgi:hypothetical protein
VLDRLWRRAGCLPLNKPRGQQDSLALRFAGKDGEQHFGRAARHFFWANIHHGGPKWHEIHDVRLGKTDDDS